MKPFQLKMIRLLSFSCLSIINFIIPVSMAESAHPASKLVPLPGYLPDSKPEFSLPQILPSEPVSAKTDEAGIQLNAIDFQGNTVFKSEQLQQLLAEFLQKKLNGHDLEQMGFIVSQFYQNAGYINSFAYLPEQDLRQGRLLIQVREGRLSDINVHGQGWLDEDYITSRLMHDEILNINQLQEKYLLLINDPLIERLNGTLSPGSELATSKLDLQVTRSRHYGLSLSGNNYRAPSIGAEQFQSHVWLRNLTGWGDLLDFNFAVSEGSTSYSGRYSIPFNGYGSQFEFQFELGDSSVIEEPLDLVNIESEVENFSWSVSHPVYQSLHEQLKLGVTFAVRKNQTYLLGEKFSFEDGLEDGKSRVSVFRLFQQYLLRGNNQVLAFRSTFNVGVNAFNATIQSDDKLPDSEFFSWLGQLHYVAEILDNGAQIKLRANLQVADDSLLSQERISIGGISSVRGYRENELVRDQGYSAGVEFHYPLFKQFNHDSGQLNAIVFMDYGEAWNKGQSSENLHSVGFGFHWQGFEYLAVDFHYAHDIKQARDKPDYNLQDDGIHFNVSVSSFH